MKQEIRGYAGSVIDFHAKGTWYASHCTFFTFYFFIFIILLIYIIYFIIFIHYYFLLFYFEWIQNVFWPRLTYKRVEPVVSISWASCFINRCVGDEDKRWLAWCSPQLNARLYGWIPGTVRRCSIDGEKSPTRGAKIPARKNSAVVSNDSFGTRQTIFLLPAVWNDSSLFGSAFDPIIRSARSLRILLLDRKPISDQYQRYTNCIRVCVTAYPDSPTVPFTSPKILAGPLDWPSLLHTL